VLRFKQYSNRSQSPTQLRLQSRFETYRDPFSGRKGGPGVFTILCHEFDIGSLAIQYRICELIRHVQQHSLALGQAVPRFIHPT